MNWKLTNFLLISALALPDFSAHAQKDASLWLTNPDVTLHSNAEKCAFGSK